MCDRSRRQQSRRCGRSCWPMVASATRRSSPCSLTPDSGPERRLLKPLKDDLQLWRLTSTASDDDLVFPTAAGNSFREHDWRNWRHRVHEPVTKVVGLERSPPYD